MNATPLRILWFLLVGWWAAGLWLLLAVLVSLPVVTAPVGYAMAKQAKGFAFGPSFE